MAKYPWEVGYQETKTKYPWDEAKHPWENEVKKAVPVPEQPAKLTLGQRFDAFIKGASPLEMTSRAFDYVGNQGVKAAQESIARKQPQIDKSQQLQAQLKQNPSLINDKKFKSDLFLSQAQGMTTPFERFAAKHDPTSKSTATQMLQEQTQDSRESFKTGMGDKGRFLSDVAFSGADLLGKAGMSATTGIPFLGLTAADTGSRSGQKALDEGYSFNKAAALAVTSGAVSAGIESFGGIAGKWGKGLIKTPAGQAIASKLPTKVLDYVNKLSATKLGKIAGNALAEGTEEFTEYGAQLFLENLILDKDTPYDIKEALASAAGGAIIGGIFGAARRVPQLPNAPIKTVPELPQAPAKPILPQAPTKTILPQIKAEPQLERLSAIKGAYNNLDTAITTKEKSGINLTEFERTQAHLLADGKIRASQLPKDINRGAIIEFANLQEGVNTARAEVNSFNQERKQQLQVQMDSLIEGSDAWIEKKSGLRHARETMERNIDDIVPDKVQAAKIKEAVFEPVHINEAKRQRFLNEQRGQVKSLNLNAKESQFVQLLGEGVITEAQLPSGIDKQKVVNAMHKMRDEIYPALLNQANDVLVQNGYKPIKARKNYFPHFNEASDPLIRALKKIGIEVMPDELPTDIAGLTHTFKPGKQWFENFLQRTGDNTIYDAVRGFDRYVEGVSNIIHHTDDIQRLRAFENAIRAKYSPAEIAEKINEIKNDNMIDEDTRQQRLDELFGRDAAHLPHFVTNLRSYTDSLAGKKSIHDRPIESDINRKIYSLVKGLEGRVAANMVALNPGSWLTNFIPLAQGGANISTESFLKGMGDTVKSYAADDGFANSSTFLTNRKGSEPLYRTSVEKVQNALASPMEMIDGFTANVITRGRYHDNIKKGMDAEAALREADNWAASVMADRSKGSLPTLFERKNPLTKLFTMFQLEVNNQLSFLFKDMPRQYQGEAKKHLATALMKYAIASFLYNEIYERLVGRRPALDPIGIGLEFYEDLSDEKTKTSQAIGNLGKNVAQEIPFASSFVGGGRLPISAAFPNVKNLLKLSDDVAPEKKADILKKELSKPAAYLLPPVGGGQIKKTFEGIKTVSDGGSYTTNSKGEKQLQFKVEKTPWNYIKGGAFGKSALPEAKEYYKTFRPLLPYAQAEKMFKAREYGIADDIFIEAYQKTKDIESSKNAAGKTIPGSRMKKVAAEIEKLPISAQKKRILFEMLK